MLIVDEQAEDWANTIRINLSMLNNLEKAKEIARTKYKNQAIALQISAFCEKKG